MLILVFSFQILEVSVIYVNFKINQDYIAEVLCINKDKPDLKCNGCCQLKKELKAQEDRSKQKESAVSPEKPLIFFVELVSDTCKYYPSAQVLQPSIIYLTLNQNNPNQVFHPPKDALSIKSFNVLL